MTLKRRLARANGMMAPLTSTSVPTMPYPGITIITVSTVLFEKDDQGHVTTRVPDDAIWKEESSGRVIVKDEAGKWRYKDDGSLMKIRGYLVSIREGVRP